MPTEKKSAKKTPKTIRKTTEPRIVSGDSTPDGRPEKKAPLAAVKERFGTKAKLVDEVVSVVEPRQGETKAQLKTRLSTVANVKLLRLLERSRPTRST